MAHCVATVASCPAMQASLDELWAIQDPSTKIAVGETGAIEYLMSDVNTSGFLQVQTNPSANKKRQVDLIYSPRILASELGSSGTATCDSTNLIGERTESYTAPTQATDYAFGFNYSDLNARCEADELYLSKKIMQVMNSIVRSMEAKTLADLILLKGSFGPNEADVTSDIKTVTTSVSADPSKGNFLEEIWYAGVNAGYESNVFVLAWNELLKAAKRLDATCCADNGLNLADLKTATGVSIIPTKGVEAVTAPNGFIMLAQGAAQLLTYNEYGSGLHEINDDTYKQGVIVHPKYGIPFDYSVNNHCGVVSVYLRVFHEAVGLPDDMFCYGDDLYGVTYINEGVVTNS